MFRGHAIASGILALPELAMVLVASSNQSGSASRAINLMELKHFVTLVFGLPTGQSFPALTRMTTASVVRFRSFAVYYIFLNRFRQKTSPQF